MERDRVYLVDMFESAQLAVSYMCGVSQETFLQDVQLQDAVIRRIEIVGEAARRISKSTREALSDMPWTEIIGMRNLMIHEYDDIDSVVVWETVQHDLPALVAALEPLIAPEND
jgi:uncharacterized protein with HEPN domain